MVKKQPKRRLWRKADIEDVEDALEDERRISKMKKPKTDGDDDGDELFTVDTKGSFEGISKSSRREIARAKLFPTKGPNIGFTFTEQAKIEKAERQLEAARRPPPAKAPEVFDLWGAPPAASTKASHSGFKQIRTAQRPSVKMPGTLHQKVGLAPAVLPAHEGQSVNPHREAYEDLACMAAAAELERERESEELDRKIRPMHHELLDVVGSEKLKGMDEEEKLRLYRKIYAKNAQADKDDEEEGAGSTKRPKKWKQKSAAYRNKKAKEPNLESKKEQARAQQRLNKSVGEVGSMLKGMQDQAELHKSRKQYRDTLRAKRDELEATAGVVPKKRKIGGGKYIEEAAVVPEAESGARGLRAMPLRASAVRDRLTSVVRRGLLPPPSEASKEKKHWMKRKNNKLKRSRKFISPLLKDNLLLR